MTHILLYEASHSELEKQKTPAAIILCAYRSTQPHPGASSAPITSLLLRRFVVVIFNFNNKCFKESPNFNVILFDNITNIIF